jgi:malonyl CoA-acyl carrier protein transacylase
MQFDSVVFPGQGAQKIGMAKDFVEAIPASAKIFEIANTILDFDIYHVCFEDADKLNRTDYTQPCILTAEIAMLEALKQEHGFTAKSFAGHSLGEYSALVAADVLTFDTALKIVQKRGELMNAAASGGGMTAIIMDQIPYQELTEIVNQFDVDVANDNSIQQVVLSGQEQAVEKSVKALTEHYSEVSFRAVPLTVSAAFHSRWMQPIEVEFKQFLSGFKDQINTTNLTRVASNYLGGFYNADKDELIDALAKQLSGSVKWRNNMELLKGGAILELGPNRPLKGFFNTLGITITSVINLRTAKKTFGDNK